MKTSVTAIIILTTSSLAMASGPYPTTLSPEERERHEFFDAQRGIRSGPEPVRTGDIIEPKLERGRAPAAASAPRNRSR